MQPRLHWIVLFLLYFAFLFWYGGEGEPLSEAETQAMLAEIRAGADAEERRPREKLLSAFAELASQDDGNEFYMINLMRFREKALYPEGSGYDDDVEAAAARYSEAVVPALLKRGSHPILLSKQTGSFLSPKGIDDWDQVAIVRYRSRRDMLDMAIELSRSNLDIHKWASLEKTHVFPAQPVIDLVFVRLAVGTLIVALASMISWWKPRLRDR